MFCVCPEHPFFFFFLSSEITSVLNLTGKVNSLHLQSWTNTHSEGKERQRHTILGSDITDDVNFIHGNLPVDFLLTKTQSSALLSAAGVRLNTQKHRALETQNTCLQYRTQHSVKTSLAFQGGHCVNLDYFTDQALKRQPYQVNNSTWNWNDHWKWLFLVTEHKLLSVPKFDRTNHTFKTIKIC